MRQYSLLICGRPAVHLSVMPSRVVNRDATAAETAYLEKLLLEAPTASRRWKQGAVEIGAVTEFPFEN